MPGVSSGDLTAMAQSASRLWAPGRRWTPGELVWATITAPEFGEVRFIRDGWAWRQEDYVAILASDAAAADEGLAWAGDMPIQLADGDAALEQSLARGGYREDPDTGFELDLRLSTGESLPFSAPAGYRLRSAEDGEDLAEVHRRSWRPADLPFAPEHRPPFGPDAQSSFDAETMARVAASPLYVRDLHMVVEAPDGSLAGSCIGWLDATNATVAIEPLGVVPEHRHRGLAGALCLGVSRRAASAGAREVVIHPRGDPAYPAPRAAYLKAGFKVVGRTRIFHPR